MKKTKQRILIVSLLAIVVMLSLATRHPEAKWRISVIKLKLSGDLPPNKTWKKLYHDLCQDLTNNTHDLSQANIKYLVEGPSIYRGFEFEDNGMCSSLWDTPLGPLWSSCWNFHEVPFLIMEQLENKIYDRYDSARIKQGDIVIDVGAHIGSFTRFALKRGARQVIAFEPSPVNIIRFKKSLKEEIKSKKVILIEAAAWDSPGTLKFKQTAMTYASNVSKDGNIIVPAVTIDDTLKRLELDHVDFIKMDIEGAERNAVAGASKTISRFRPRMTFEFHLADDPEVISSLVFDANPDYKFLQNEKIAYFFDETNTEAPNKKTGRLKN